jgi:hypothetical protein
LITPAHAATAAVAGAVFAFSWLFRFNDPNGSFAGLTDDHFFYLVRGWQILFGELPVRDFVDHGSPLYSYVGAAVQVLFGRGTLSEIAFSATVLALGAALTFWLAARAAGSIAAGLAGAVFHVLLAPRFYNYPKVLVYAVAVPLLWRFADTPTPRLRAALALTTAIAFLFRHDHGVFVGLVSVGLMLLIGSIAWRERLRHVAIYGLLTVAILSPYLVFVEVHGGVVAYLLQGAEWAARDRGRAEVVWPGLFDNPDGVSGAAREGSIVGRASATVRDNAVAWMYYVEIALPILVLLLLTASRDGLRPGWPNARLKLATVAVLALILDVGFLRSPLAARLADPSVPLAILMAWLSVAIVRLVAGAGSLRPGLQRRSWLVRIPGAVAAASILLVPAVALSHELYDRLDAAALVDGPRNALERVSYRAAEYRRDWQLDSWAARSDRTELIELSRYLQACTTPADRVLVQGYLPQVLALAQRGFAGGHADLRPGFFGSDAAQRLTVSRLQRQSVPLILLDADDSYEEFRTSFPLVTAYIDRRYAVAGTRVLDGRHGLTLLVSRDREPAGTFEAFGWPCFAGRGTPQR